MPVENENSAILLARMHDAADRMYSILINRGAVERLAKALDSVENGKPVRKNVTFARITREMLEEINVIRELQGKNPLVSRNVIAFAGAINGHLTKHIKEYGSVENIAKVAFEVLISSDTLVLPANYKEGNKGSLLVKQKTERFADSVVIGDTRNGKTSLKSISPRSTREIKKLSKERNKMLERRLGRGENYPTSDTD